MDISFTVYGIPTPQGSMKAFVNRRTRRAYLTTDNKRLKPWRQEVSGAAVVAFAGVAPAERKTGVGVYLSFFFDRPKSVSKKIADKTTKPDLDKLLRGVLDSLTGIAYEDDSQVVRSGQSKQFGSPARVEVRVLTAE